MQWLFVAVGGALGAVCRFAIIGYLYPVAGNRFPTGTLVVNVLGCLLVGAAYVLIVEKAMLNPYWRHILMTGFLGALTTFSTFSLDALLLWQNGLHTTAVVYVLANVVLCLLAVTLAWYFLHAVVS
ncbi:MAG TPA: fluoride efflux transporter CrcB [Cellvibrionaceae bacterium]